MLERIGPRRPQDRATTRQDAAGRLDRELLVLALERTLPPVAEPDDHVTVHVNALAHDRPDRRVQSLAVAASGEHADAHARTIPGAWAVGIASGRAGQGFVPRAHDEPKARGGRITGG